MRNFIANRKYILLLSIVIICMNNVVAEEDLVPKKLNELLINHFQSKEQNKQVRDYCKALASKGEASGIYCLSMFHFYGAGVKQDFNKYFEYIKSSAEQGYVPAMFSLASAYDNGKIIVDHNSVLAMKWYTEAAKKGSKISMRRLAAIYKNGDLGVKKNLDKSRYWNDKAHAK